jgi:hypothetical protein
MSARFPAIPILCFRVYERSFLFMDAFGTCTFVGMGELHHERAQSFGKISETATYRAIVGRFANCDAPVGKC